ncbi:MAG: type 1 glutamine amidotransferase, partial [Euryarchaeota archaeon]|nr:type 1 glutamine amidotransferase [Euryarchaeota archaeon]MCG2735164.1 type 1 glutamine amidotransferase [Candidatus Methanoperedenaceae archaeon]
MRIHSLEHEKFEGLANIKVWAKNRGHSISRTLLFKNEELPDITDIDWLVIMGGSMNVYEEEKYPWLRDEKNFIAQAIAGKKIVLGVCLGAQLIADALGGKVSRNRYAEIGWFPLTLTKEARTSPVFNALPLRFTAFHWHGDTFEIPSGAVRIAQSEACANQAFEYGRTIGLQFHLEYSEKSIDLMFRNCADDIVDGRYIQKPEEI